MTTRHSDDGRGCGSEAGRSIPDQVSHDVPLLVDVRAPPRGVAQADETRPFGPALYGRVCVSRSATVDRPPRALAMRWHSRPPSVAEGIPERARRCGYPVEVTSGASSVDATYERVRRHLTTPAT